jgi:hypothetical protein
MGKSGIDDVRAAYASFIQKELDKQCQLESQVSN